MTSMTDAKKDAHTDRELLEGAARVAGLTLRWVGDMLTVPYTPEESAQRNGVDGYCWNPLADDGDALRLAVKLRLHLGLEDHAMTAWEARGYGYFKSEPADPDPYAATRRAIVRAAAALVSADPLALKSEAR